MKLYGSLTARLEEGKNYIDDGIIKEGTDITMYYYSDQHCYYVTKVNNQKDIFVKQYSVCADHSKEGGMGHQNWLYFKSANDMNKYLNEKLNENFKTDFEEEQAEEWVYRYNNWCRKVILNNEIVEIKNNHAYSKTTKNWINLTQKEIDTINSGKDVVKYYPLSGKISLGVRDYYYDWEF